MNDYFLPKSAVVQSTGTSTTNVLSQKAISDNYALKSSIPSNIPTITQDITGTSTTAAPSQKAVNDGIFATVKSSSNGRVGQFYANPLSFTDNSSSTDKFCVEFASDQATGGTLPFKAELASKKFTEATYLKAAPNIAGENKAASAVSGWDSDTAPGYQSVVQLICKKIDGYTKNGGYQPTVSYNALGGGVTTPIALASQADIADLQAQITALTARVAKLENPSG